MNSRNPNSISSDPALPPLQGNHVQAFWNYQLQIIHQADERFRYQLIKAMRTELMNQIWKIQMSDSTKSYLLHQLAQTHDLEGLNFIVSQLHQC